MRVAGEKQRNKLLLEEIGKKEMKRCSLKENKK
jgi:hypothetical protein